MYTFETDLRLYIHYNMMCGVFTDRQYTQLLDFSPVQLVMSHYKILHIDTNAERESQDRTIYTYSIMIIYVYFLFRLAFSRVSCVTTAPPLHCTYIGIFILKSRHKCRAAG